MARYAKHADFFVVVTNKEYPVGYFVNVTLKNGTVKRVQLGDNLSDPCYGIVGKFPGQFIYSTDAAKKVSGICPWCNERATDIDRNSRTCEFCR